MGHKHFNIRYIAFTFVIFIIMYSVVSYLHFGRYNNNDKSLNLLSNPPQMVYGTSADFDNELAIKLDQFGVALVLFSTIDFKAEDYSQLALSVKKLPKNYHVKLIVVSEENPLPHELLLLQPDGGVQSNFLIKDLTWKGKVKKVGLRFSPQDDLGLSIPFHESIYINKAVFNNAGYFENYFTLLNYWLDYEPWAYLSISHLEVNETLSFYTQPVVFLILWAIICLILYFILHKKRVNLFAIIVSWLVLDFLFLHNMNENKKWIQNIYSSEIKEMPDDELYEMSIQIKDLFGGKQDLLDMKQNKIYILTLSKYNGIRLAYHLLPLNVGFWGTQLPASKFNEGDYILSYGYPNERILPVNGVLSQNDSSVNVIQVIEGTDFNLLKVVN